MVYLGISNNNHGNPPIQGSFRIPKSLTQHHPPKKPAKPTKSLLEDMTSNCGGLKRSRYALHKKTLVTKPITKKYASSNEIILQENLE